MPRLDGDGYPDLALATYNTGPDLPAAHVYMNQQDGTFAAATDYYPNAIALFIDVADFDGDGKPDLLVGNLLNGMLAILRNHGDGTFEAPVEYDGDGVLLAIAADMNDDGHPDAVVINAGGPGTNGIGVMLNAGDGTLGPVTSFAAGALPNFIAAGDFNGDGYTDIAVTNAGDGTLGILLNQQDGSLGAQISYPTGDVPADLLAADFDGDDKLDIVVVNGIAGTLGYFSGQGDGTFVTGSTFPTDINPYAVAVGDLDQDGRPDVAVSTGYTDNTVTTLLNQCP